MRRTVREKLDSLDKDSAWIFTKQTTDFDEVFRATQLFHDYYQSDENLEQIFEEYHQDYGVETNRHRIWIMSQMFGLITKTPFFRRGSKYKDERPTEIFENLNKHEIGSSEYNTLKTEQLLKVRIKPIIDSSPDHYDKVILPLIFSYQVLKKLKMDYSINHISTDQFYTYVMTCKNFSELEEAVWFLKENSSVSDLVNNYKDSSRIQSLFEKNSNLILFNEDKVYINSTFESVFDDFLESIDIFDLEIILENPNSYAYFLYTPQNFNLNLIDLQDESCQTLKHNPIKRIVEKIDDEENYDSNYVKLADEVKEDNLNDRIAKNAYKNEIQFKSTSQSIRIVRNPLFGKLAIKKAKYKCCYNNTHKTFTSRSSGKPFMEAHHLIPIKYAKEIYEKYKLNIDCIENIVSLCPNCHRAVHYGANNVKKDKITDLYNKMNEGYKEIGLEIDLEELFKMYSIKK